MEATIRIQSRLGKRRLPKRTDAGGRPRDAAGTPPSPFLDTLARRLALAHYIERLIDPCELRNYAQAAAVLGITRARMSQLMDLALLPADMQERILVGTERAGERELRTCATRPLVLPTGQPPPEPRHST